MSSIVQPDPDSNTPDSDELADFRDALAAFDRAVREGWPVHHVRALWEAIDDTLTEAPAIGNDGDMCEECADQPHEFRHDGDPRFPDHCVCGRIRSIGGYSPVHTDEGHTERDDQ